jgi:hypothetical protein
MLRILIGAVVGGIAVFVWSAVSHMVLPTGDMGLKSLPGEDAIVAVLKQNVHESGVYFVPGMDMKKKLTPEQQKAWNAKIATGPTGLFVYNPGGSEPMSPRQLLIELASNMLCALIAALVLRRMSGGYFARAMVVCLMGLFAWLSISISYRNWYQFSDAFTQAEAVDQIAGWLVGGLVVAGIVRPTTA